MKLPEWGTVQRLRRRFGSRPARASPRCSPGWSRRSTAARRPSGRHDRVRVARRPDQGCHRPRDRHPPRPVPTHRRCPACSVTAIAWGRRAGRAHRQLHRAPSATAAFMSHERFFEFDEVDAFTPGRSATRASAVLPPGPRRARARRREVREATGGRDRRVPASLLTDLPTPEDRPVAARSSSRDPLDPFRPRPDRARLRPRERSRPHALEEVGASTTRENRSTSEHGHVRLYVTRSQARVLRTRRQSSRPAGRPACGAASRWTPTATLPTDELMAASPRQRVPLRRRSSSTTTTTRPRLPPAVELPRRGGSFRFALLRGRARGRRPDAIQQQRDLPRTSPRRSSHRAIYKPGAASGRCGTSSPVCTAGGGRVSAERRLGSAWCHRRFCATARSVRDRCSASSTPTSPALLHAPRGTGRSRMTVGDDGALDVLANNTDRKSGHCSAIARR